MPPRDEWLALAERCEKAERPDRELDAALWWSTEKAAANRAFFTGAPGLPKAADAMPDQFEKLPSGLGRASVIVCSEKLTASIDAAVAVVEARFGKEWALGHSGTLCLAAITSFPKRIEGLSYFNDALALMAAYCRARAEEEGG